jgi:hypothetical protein
MGQTPFIETFKNLCGYSNVDSTTGCVERVGVVNLERVSLWRCACSIACSLLFAGGLLASGCVETAECNDTVSCPDEQVCYAYTCRDVCETQQECAAAESCTPCTDDGADSDEGECFGEELSACVPEE